MEMEFLAFMNYGRQEATVFSLWNPNKNQIRMDAGPLTVNGPMRIRIGRGVGLIAV
ncbi:hypothetical protein BSG1_03485 [Bacillus sp. SG-1]|nr:hypothetical protein BSG1_03485 [Bacillus sp. SG-1]